MTADINSMYYPYTKVQNSYIDLSEALSLPRKICDYIIDAPKGDYQPPDNNKYARCRLWKYLYYDEAFPLEKPLPTIKQKMNVVFNPDNPTKPPTDKGYRLIPQIFVEQSQEIAQTRLMFHLGRTVPSNDEFKVCMSVVFYVWTNYTYELNTKQEVYSRTLGIEQAIIEAFHGVNMAGVGTFFYSKAKHSDCGSTEIFDGDTNVGRKITLALEIASNVPKNISETKEMPKIGDNLFIPIGL